MPELPEVETIRRQLEPELLGRTIVSASVLDERWTRPEPTAAMEAGLRGRRIESVGRRGKYLLVGLDDGATLLMHLRMTGNLLLATDDEPAGHRLGMDRLYPAPTVARAPAGRARARRRPAAAVHGSPPLRPRVPARVPESSTPTSTRGSGWSRSTGR